MNTSNGSHFMAMLRNDTLTGMVKKLKMPNLNTNGIITLITAMMMSAHTKNAILAFLFGATILLSPVLLLTLISLTLFRGTKMFYNKRLK